MTIFVDVYEDGEFKEVREVELKEYLDMSKEEKDECFGHPNEFYDLLFREAIQ